MSSTAQSAAWRTVSVIKGGFPTLYEKHVYINPTRVGIIARELTRYSFTTRTHEVNAIEVCIPDTTTFRMPVSEFYAYFAWSDNDAPIEDQEWLSDDVARDNASGTYGADGWSLQNDSVADAYHAAVDATEQAREAFSACHIDQADALLAAFQDAQSAESEAFQRYNDACSPDAAAIEDASILLDAMRISATDIMEKIMLDTHTPSSYAWQMSVEAYYANPVADADPIVGYCASCGMQLSSSDSKVWINDVLYCRDCGIAQD